MCMTRCAHCLDLVDTDEDPESYVEPLSAYLCEACRERYDDECREGERVDAMNDELWMEGRV